MDMHVCTFLYTWAWDLGCSTVINMQVSWLCTSFVLFNDIKDIILWFYHFMHFNEKVLCFKCLKLICLKPNTKHVVHTYIFSLTEVLFRWHVHYVSILFLNKGCKEREPMPLHKISHWTYHMVVGPVCTAEIPVEGIIQVDGGVLAGHC